MLLTVGARRRTTPTTTTTTTPNPEASNPDLTLPYAMPTAAPWNAPVPMVTPNYTGSGESAHPSVLDFQQINGGTWHGWRYWLAHTPYTGGNDDYENPAILVSQNGFHWQKPAGVRDPVYPMPATGFSSDTHLQYDPTADQLILLHRTTLDNINHTIYITRSSDGVTWPANPTAAALTQTGQPLSPALVRVAEGDWRLFALHRESRGLQVWTASSADGPWDGPFETVGASWSDGFWGWHLDVQHHSGQFWALVDRGPLYLGHPDGYRSATSADGYSWQMGGADFMSKTAGWDNVQLYRAAFLPHENGISHRLWYSAQCDVAGAQVWRSGYTIVPRSLWPASPGMPVAGTRSAYGTAVATDTPAVWWRMEGDHTATVEADVSGNGRVGTYWGAHVRASSLSGDSRWASRVYRGGLFRTHEAWMDTNTLTLEAVVRSLGGSGTRPLVSLWGSTGGWELRLVGSNLSVAHSDGTTIAGGTAPNGVTRHVAVVVNSGAVTLYVDGVSVASGTLPAVTLAADSRLAVGARWSGSSWAAVYSGALDEIAVYAEALSAARVLAHAQAVGP